MGYIYVIEYKGCYKIGKTSRPVEKRIKEFNLPERPRIVDIIETVYMDRLEKYLHALCKIYKIDREWFKFKDDEECRQIIHSAINDEGKSLFDDVKGFEHEKFYVRAKRNIDILNIPGVIPDGMEFVIYDLKNCGKPCTFDEARTCRYDTFFIANWYLKNASVGFAFNIYAQNFYNVRDWLAFVSKDKFHPKKSKVIAVNAIDSHLSEYEKEKLEENTKPITLENIKELATVGDNDGFWTNYNLAKRVLSYNDWASVKYLFHSNPIFQEWKQAKDSTELGTKQKYMPKEEMSSKYGR